MKLTIDRDAALKALQRVQGVTSRKSTLPILCNVLLEATRGRLHIVATDGDVEASTSAPCGVQRDGEVTMPAQQLNEILRATTPGAELTMDATGARMAVQAGRSRYQLPTLPASDFPHMPKDRLDAEFTLAAGGLERLLAQVDYAICQEETRPQMGGVFMHRLSDGSALRVVAVDGHRMSYAQEAVELDGDLPPAVIPRKTVGALRTLLSDVEGEVTVRLSDSKALFVVGETQLVTSLIGSTFVDYQRVIPRELPTAMRVSVGALSAAVRRAMIMSSARDRGVRFSASGDLLTVSTRTAEKGQEAVDEVEIELDGGDFEVGFNGAYVLEMLERIDGETATLQFADRMTATVWTGKEPEWAKAVVMPLKV